MKYPNLNLLSESMPDMNVGITRTNTNDRMKMLAMHLNEDLRTEVCDFNEESSPLVIALKKLQQKNVKQYGIKMWTNSLADLFYITDTDGSGAIEPDEYKQMVEKLEVSKPMKSALRDKFSEIDKNNTGSISLYEFLYFFLKYPKFNEELLVNAHSNAPYIMEKDLSWWQRLRLKVYFMVECPETNIFSKGLFCLDLLVTSVPIVVLCMQALRPSSVIKWGENVYLWIVSIFFAVQYILGLVTCRDSLKFIKSWWHCLELVSFVFWILYNTFLPSGSLDPMGFVLFRILRVVKLHKVFKLESFGENLAIYTDTLQLAYTSYGAVLGFLSMLMMFFAILFYVFERGSYLQDEDYDGVWVRDKEEGESPFSTLPNSIYFTIVTFTTLGYGDISPKSLVGKLVAVFAVVAGLCNLTFLINIIGDCFEEVFRVFVQRRSSKMEKERQNFIEKQIKRADKHVKEMRSRSKKRTLRGHVKMIFKGGDKINGQHDEHNNVKKSLPLVDEIVD